MSAPTGFYKRDDKTHPITPRKSKRGYNSTPRVRVRHQSKYAGLSREQLEIAREMNAERSKRAQSLDERLRAPAALSLEEWRHHMNRTDLAGVDAPRGQIDMGGRRVPMEKVRQKPEEFVGPTRPKSGSAGVRPENIKNVLHEVEASEKQKRFNHQARGSELEELRRGIPGEDSKELFRLEEGVLEKYRRYQDSDSGEDYSAYLRAREGYEAEVKGVRSGIKARENEKEAREKEHLRSIVKASDETIKKFERATKTRASDFDPDVSLGGPMDRDHVMMVVTQPEILERDRKAIGALLRHPPTEKYDYISVEAMKEYDTAKNQVVKIGESMYNIGNLEKVFKTLGNRGLTFTSPEKDMPVMIQNGSGEAVMLAPCIDAGYGDRDYKVPSLRVINRDERSDKQLRADRREYASARKQAVDQLFEDARAAGWGGGYRDHPPDYVNKNLDGGQPGPQGNAREQVAKMAEVAYGRKVHYEETPERMIGTPGHKYDDVVRVTYAKKPPEIYSETLGPKVDIQAWGEHG